LVLKPYGTAAMHCGKNDTGMIGKKNDIYVSCQLDSMNVVTKTIGRIDFIHGAKHGDIVEIGMETIAMGRSSITVKATIRNMKTLKVITQVDDIVFVNIKDGKPFSHGKQI
jgi:acyl-CoA thioesterase YciA